MKASFLVNLEFDSDSELLSGYPDFRPTPENLLTDLNDWLRSLVSRNPYGLRDPEHLRLTVELANPAIQRERKPLATVHPGLKVTKYLVQIERHPDSRRFAPDEQMRAQLESLARSVVRVWTDDANPIVSVIPEERFWHDPDATK